MSNTLRSLSHPQPMVSNIEEWARAPEPVRRCMNCPTKLSRYNPNDLCHLCNSKHTQEDKQW